MFVVTLKFSENKVEAPRLMPAHNEWLRRGFADGVFLTAGSLAGGLGGAIVAHGMTRDELDARLAEDPFVADRVVSAEIIEITPARTDDRLSFLLA